MKKTIIDIHAHIWLGSAELDAALLRRASEEYGIEKILVSCLGSHQPAPPETAELNRRTAALVAADPLFGGYVTVSPEHRNSLDVLRRGIEEQNLLGMKLWVSCLCDEASCDPLYEYCGQWGVPVLIHAFAKTTGQLPGESTAVHVRNAAQRHPRTQFIMAHLGGNCYHGLPLIRDLPNVWTDFSGSTSRNDDLPYALELLGPQRILFGTDMPGSFVMSYGQVLSAELSEGDRQLILRENALALFPQLRENRNDV